MIRILIADDHAILRRGLKEILVRELEGAVCAEAEDAQQVLAQVQSQEWDVVVLDITGPVFLTAGLYCDTPHPN